MNESETRAEYIDPKLKMSGWGEVEGSKVLRERDVCKITDGRILSGGERAKPEIADYILVYKNKKIAVIEAKKDELKVGEGVAQAKSYAEKLQINYTYATQDHALAVRDLVNQMKESKNLNYCARVMAKDKIFEDLDEKQKEFLDFVLLKYKEKGVEELDEEKLPILLNLKYHAIANAEKSLGGVEKIRSIFFNFQKSLYAKVNKEYVL